jgi:predicted ester cyclase
MPTRDNKSIYRAFIEQVANRGNFAAADELLSDDVVEYELLPAGLPPNGDGIRRLFRMLRGAFPDFNITIEDLLSDGDKVIARVTLRGTHRGELLGLAPTGRKVEYEAIDISRIAGGRMVEHWGIPDYLTLFRQLGIPAGP